MDMDAVNYPRYRWLLLGIACIGQICLIWNLFLIPSLATELYPVFGLNQLRYTLIFTAPMIMTILTSPLGGGLTDRFGIRLMVFVALAISGVAGLARAFTPNFATLLLMALLLGLATSFLRPNLSKLVGSWFPRHQIGMASGIYGSSQAIGFSVGLMTGPLFQTWREAFLYVGLVTLAIAIIWLIMGRDVPPGFKYVKAPFTAGIRRAVSSRNMILTAIIALLLLGAFNTFSANMPKSLIIIHNVDPVKAGNVTSMLTWGSFIGTLLIPFLSDRLGLRRPFIFGCAFGAAISLYLAWYFAPGTATLVWMILGGICLGGVVPILFTIPLEFPEIGTRYVGGSAALENSLGNLGSVLLPLAIAPVISVETQAGYDRGFALATALLVVVVLPAWFLMETGWRKIAPHHGEQPQNSEGDLK